MQCNAFSMFFSHDWWKCGNVIVETEALLMHDGKSVSVYNINIAA